MAVRIPCPECRKLSEVKADGFQKLFLKECECPICKEQKQTPFRAFQCGHAVCDECYGTLADAAARRRGPPSVADVAMENERRAMEWERRSDGMGATRSFPYPAAIGHPRFEAGRGREGRRTRREDPKKRFSKALVTLLRFPNTNFTHLSTGGGSTRIEVHGQDMSVRLCEALELTESNVMALELTESNVNGWRNPRPYEELKAMFDEIIAEDGHLNDNRRFRTCGHGLDTRVSATYGHGPTAFTSVRLS